MRKLLLILCLILASCSKDPNDTEGSDPFFMIITRDTCITGPETIYTESEVNEQTYNKVVEENEDKHSCDPIIFEDINNNLIKGIYSGNGRSN